MSEGLVEVNDIHTPSAPDGATAKLRHTSTDIRCPAAEDIHPVTSLNKKDALCRIIGHVQPAKGSPCCGEYDRCMIWRTELNRTRFGRNNTSGGSVAAPKTRRASRASGIVGPEI